MDVAANKAGDTDSSQAPGITFITQGSLNVGCWCHSDSASVLSYFTLQTVLMNESTTLDITLIHLKHRKWNLPLPLISH